jgi:prepilin-type N-terminal cleavage/methylation domain-containing protein
MGKAVFRRQSGITLIELLVVMVILSIALGLVAPSMANSYQSWQLRSSGRRTAALFRFASDLARRQGTDLAGYYADHRFVVLRKGSVVKTLDIPASISVKPEKPRGAVFLPTGQILATEPFVLENEKGRKMIVEVGPLPGEVHSKESR